MSLQFHEPSKVMTVAVDNPISVTSGKPIREAVAKFSVTLSAGNSYTLDFSSFVQTKQIFQVQGFFIDGSGSSEDILIRDSGGAVKSIPAGYQAILPIYLASPYSVTIQGAGDVTITMLNFPCQPMLWPGSAIGRGPYVFDGNTTNGLKKVHAGQSNYGTVVPGQFGAFVPVVTTSDPVNVPFINQIHVDARRLTATTPGLIKVSLWFITVAPMPALSRYLFVESVPTAGNVAAAWDMHGLQETGISGNNPFSMKIEAITASGFAGEIDYMIIGGESNPPY